MKFELKDRNSLIIIDVKIYGKDLNGDFRLALDTGCTQTIVRPEILFAIGYRPQDFTKKIGVTTGTRTEEAFEYEIDGIETLGYKIKKIRVVAKKLPMGLMIDGLIGLDFFKILRKKLTIDFDKRELLVE
jgi:hypothetical protein